MTTIMCFSVYQQGIHIASGSYDPNRSSMTGYNFLKTVVAQPLGPGVYTIQSSLYATVVKPLDIVVNSPFDFLALFGPPIFSVIEGTVTIKWSSTCTCK